MITRHANERLNERTNFNSNEKKNNVHNALKRGKKVSFFRGELYEFLKSRQNPQTKIRVYKNNIYIFSNNDNGLITMYPIPENFIPYETTQKKIRCLIMVDKNFYAQGNRISEDIAEALEFTSIEKAKEFIRNNMFFKKISGKKHILPLI